MSHDGKNNHSVVSVAAKLCVLRNSFSSMLHSGKSNPNLSWLKGVEAMLREAIDELQQGLHVHDVDSAMVQSKQKATEESSKRDYSDRRLIWNPFRLPNSTSEAAFKGNLKSLGLSTVFQTLSSENKTGILLISRGQMQRVIFLKDGNIIAARGNESLRLGQILYHRKLISNERLEEALDKARISGKRIGEMLLSLGYISNYTLKQLIRQQVRETLWDLSRWKEGDFQYRDYPVKSDKLVTEDISAGSIPSLGRRPKEDKKRQHSRVKVSWPASILSTQGPVDGEVKNISLTGALISLRELPNPNGALRLVIEIPEFHYNVLATAEMIRLDIQQNDDDLTAYLLGVRFGEISEKDRRFLASRILH